jgi:hypothetical protein
MKISSYQAKLLSLRLIRDRAQLVSERRIIAILRQSADDLERLIARAGEGTFTRAAYEKRKGEIEKVISQMTIGVNSVSQSAMRGVANDVSGNYVDNLEKFITDKGREMDIEKLYFQVPRKAVLNVTSRLWADGNNFSDRIWSLNKYANDAINKAVSAGIARGESAVDLSKDIRNFLIDPQISSGASWTTAAKKSATGRGTVHYNALRLARTEINSTYRETLILSNEENPVTLGVKWNLSKSHPKPDVCDLWASLDQYGLGAGVYPPMQAPIDHPNGMCYVTEVIRQPSEWEKPKPEVEKKRISKEQILSNLDEEYQDAAWSQFRATDAVIRKNQRLYKKAA